MFKQNIYRYIFMVFFTFVLFLVGCKGANPITNITVLEQSEENPLTFVVGEFSYEEIEVKVSYENGETKVVGLTEEMINPDDLIKLYKLGENEIEVIYEKHKTKMFIYGTYKEFKDVYLNDVTTTYTGEEFKVELEGNVPATAQIVYPKGNTYKDAGTYEVVAIIYENGYEVLELSAAVVINKAVYDMSDVKLEDSIVTYDGYDKSILVTGKLPSGVSVNYTIDGKYVSSVKEAGTYEVVASFTGDSRNYHPIDSMSATLTINKATYNMDGVRLEDKEVVYDTFAHNLSLTNEDLLPSGVNPIYKNNSHTDVGEYEVTVEFEVEDTNNYNEIAPMSATLTIVKEEFDFGDIDLLSQQVTYEEGKTYSLSLSNQLPDFVTVTYYYYPQENQGTYKSLFIDATDGYWINDNSGYVKVGKGTIINMNVNSRSNVILDVENSLDNFNIEVNEGVATITCLNDDGIKSITLENPADTTDKTVVEVDECDVIFHNQNDPLKDGLLPSLKGEYLVIAKLVVNDNNYYGEIEKVAFLIIE